jgi:hypothetical protein
MTTMEAIAEATTAEIRRDNGEDEAKTGE